MAENVDTPRKDLDKTVIKILFDHGKKTMFKKGMIQKELFRVLKSAPNRFLNDEIDVSLKKLVNDDKNWDEEFKNRERKIKGEKLVPIIGFGDEKSSDVYMVKIGTAFGQPWGSRYWFVGKKHRPEYEQ